MKSGGSTVSTSLTCDFEIVTVQVSFSAKSVPGSIVNVTGPPAHEAACAPLVGHVIANHGSVTSTGSLNVTVIDASRATDVASAAGIVETTAGAVSVVVRGFGAPTAKSFALLSVSCAPPFLRSAAVVFVRVA